TSASFDQRTEAAPVAATGSADARAGASTLASSTDNIGSGIKKHKLVAATIALVVLLGIGIGSWSLWRRSLIANTGELDSIAVLPFENAIHDQKMDYLSDGVTESLINSLTQLPRVKVIARNSVFTYKNQTPNLQQVAKQLGVRAVLTGRVLMQGETL